MAVVHLSPELPRLSVRGHKRVGETEPFDFLSASYPSPTAAVETSTTDEPSPPPLQRSYSGRPRSQSSDVTHVAAKTRKSLRGLGRSRVAAGMGGWIRSRQGSGGGALGDGVHRRASASDAEEASAEIIESAFNRIREQLAKFSEEDVVLKERVERLNEEIEILQGPVEKLRDTQKLHDDTHHHRLKHSTWKSPHFSASVSETDLPHGYGSFSQDSVPVVMVSKFSSDDLYGNFNDPVHETIVEREERGAGDDDEEEEEEEGWKRREVLEGRRPGDRSPKRFGRNSPDNPLNRSKLNDTNKWSFI